MKLTQTNSFKKLEAEDNKMLRLKRIDYDEEGKEIERELIKVVYLPINASEDEYEEIDEVN